MSDLYIDNLWSKVLDNIKVSISKPAYETWIAPLTAKMADEDLLIICAQNEFAKDWVEARYKSLIFEMIRAAAGRTFEIDFISIESDKNKTSTIFRMDKRQALGYFLLACNEANLPKDKINEIYKNMCRQFYIKPPEEAEKEGYKWYETL
jgi:chromosomal replication initiation ATPase DnaA